jgi:hypothetical protein
MQFILGVDVLTAVCCFRVLLQNSLRQLFMQVGSVICKATIHFLLINYSNIAMYFVLEHNKRKHIYAVSTSITSKFGV